MENTIYTEKLATLNSKVSDLNGKIKAEDTATNVATALEAAKNALKEVNKAWRNEQYAELRATEDPMGHALKIGQIKEHKLAQNKNSGLYAVDEAVRRIDLLDFEAFCLPKDIAKDTCWKFKAANFARLLTAYTAVELGLGTAKRDEILASYRLIHKCERDAKPTLLSKSNMEKELQAVVDMLYFTDNGQGKNTVKITSADVAFMHRAFCKQARSIGVITAGTPKTMADILLQIMNIRLNNLSYNIEYKAN